MTRTYALKRLLEHGALTPTQMRQITGWTIKQVHGTLDQLLSTGLVTMARARFARDNLYRSVE